MRNLPVRVSTASAYRIDHPTGPGPVARTAPEYQTRAYPMWDAMLPSRRHFLGHVAGLSALAVPGIQFVQGLAAAAPALKKKNKSLIILWMGGGPPTIDLWDLKPGTPTGGEFKPVKTSASGVEICEHLPLVAKQMKHLAIVRSLTTKEGDHDRGTRLMNTGNSPSPLLDYPSIGSVVAKKLTPADLDLPSFISVGGTAQRIGPGFLGMTFAPFTVQNPGQPPENVRAPDGVTEARMHMRESIFKSVEGSFGQTLKGTGKADNPTAKAHGDVYGKALSLAVSKRKEVFQLDKEPKALLDEYGNNNFGKGCLLARKLVEAGSTCVEVDLGGWDLHANIFPQLANQRLPTLDKGMGTLVRDLADRGMLKDTVIVWMGDFGRTPRINQNAGRDHYPRNWSVVIGGGAVKGGQVYGSTNSDGTAIKDNPVEIHDLYATIYQALGIDPSVEKDASIRDNLGRPYAIAGTKFKLLKELVG